MKLANCSRVNCFGKRSCSTRNAGVVSKVSTKPDVALVFDVPIYCAVNYLSQDTISVPLIMRVASSSVSSSSLASNVSVTNTQTANMKEIEAREMQEYRVGAFSHAGRFSAGLFPLTASCLTTDSVTIGRPEYP